VGQGVIEESESGASRGDAQSAALGMAMAEVARDASAAEFEIASHLDLSNADSGALARMRAMR